MSERIAQHVSTRFLNRMIDHKIAVQRLMTDLDMMQYGNWDHNVREHAALTYGRYVGIINDVEDLIQKIETAHGG